MPDLPVEAQKSASAKIDLRRRVLAARREMSPELRRRAAEDVQRQTLDLVRRTAPSTVAAYVPVGSEPGGPELPALLAASVVRVLLPVLMPDADLDWAVFDGTLAPGPRGLAEPAGPRLGVRGIQSADLIFVPALAVDRTGYRIGRGGGSYDRALSRLPHDSPRPQVLALLYDGELIANVPAEAHDQPVDGAITPAGVSLISRGH